MNYKHNPKLTNVAKNLRKNMTKEEKHLWYDFLKTYPVRFLRQKVIENYVVDFYCAKARVVVELDGSQHFEDENIVKDASRTKVLEERGLKVIRIPNNEVNNNFESVCDYIRNCVEESLRQAMPATSL